MGVPPMPSVLEARARRPCYESNVRSQLHIADAYRSLMKAIGWDAPEAVFADTRLRVWRDLPDRDNSTLDVEHDGRNVRLHVKRDKRKRSEPMALEAAGITLLNAGGIATAPLVAHGTLADGRTFVVTENLDGFTSADRLLETGTDPELIWNAVVDVAVRLHAAGLHHRDLYANHFYLRPTDAGYDVRLIDTARVRRLPWLTRGRWIVKDVGQLAFSAEPHDDEVLRMYCARAGRSAGGWFAWRVRQKAASIARHDAALRAKSPTRNLRLADGN